MGSFLFGPLFKGKISPPKKKTDWIGAPMSDSVHFPWMTPEIFAIPCIPDQKALSFNVWIKSPFSLNQSMNGRTSVMARNSWILDLAKPNRAMRMPKMMSNTTSKMSWLCYFPDMYMVKVRCRYVCFCR